MNKQEQITAPPADAITGPGTDTFEIAEVRYAEDGKTISEVVLQLPDGRMVPALLDGKLELTKDDVLKTSTAVIKHQGVDDGVPGRPVVTKINR